MTTDFWDTPVTLGERRVLHPGPLRWLRALGWIVPLFILSAVPTGICVTFLEHVLPGTGLGEGPASVVANLIGGAIAIGIYSLVVWGGEARQADEVVNRRAPTDLIAGLAIGVAMFASVMAIMAVFGLYEIVWKGAAAPWQPLAKSIESGVMEELLIRAVMLRLLWRAFGPWVAFAISAAFFGAAHLANPNATPFAALCIAVEAGIMLGAFYALTGRLWVSIGVHAAWNFTQGYIFGAAVSGSNFGAAMASSTARPGFAEVLTGGAFGPEASLPGLIVGTSVGVVVMVLAWKAGRFEKGDKPVL